MADLNILEAVRLAMDEEMERDERVMVLGEDVGKKGGVFGATEGLFAKYGERRVLDTPLTEGRSVIDMKTPYRSEDAAYTPVSITAGIPQTPERYIKDIYVFVEKNPQPLAGFDLVRVLQNILVRIEYLRVQHLVAVVLLGDLGQRLAFLDHVILRVRVFGGHAGFLGWVAGRRARRV